MVGEKSAWKRIASRMAGPTRLELATSGVTGRRSNQTELRPRVVIERLIIEQYALPSNLAQIASRQEEGRT